MVNHSDLSIDTIYEHKTRKRLDGNPLRLWCYKINEKHGKFLTLDVCFKHKIGEEPEKIFEIGEKWSVNTDKLI